MWPSLVALLAKIRLVWFSETSETQQKFSSDTDSQSRWESKQNKVTQAVAGQRQTLGPKIHEFPPKFYRQITSFLEPRLPWKVESSELWNF